MSFSPDEPRDDRGRWTSGDVGDPNQPSDDKGRWTSGDVGVAPGTPGVNAPRVYWGQIDDPGNAELQRQSHDPRVQQQQPRIYRAMIPMPAQAAIAVANKGFTRTGVYAPTTLEVTARGTSHLIDGHHRVAYWRQQGFTHAPAWVIDYRKGRPVTPSRRVKKL